MLVTLTAMNTSILILVNSTPTAALAWLPNLGRARLAGGIAIIPTAPERQRNRDSDYLYRHDSYFYYLTGFTEPHATLVITAEGECTLVLPAQRP
jgi:hypothetical protein